MNYNSVFLSYDPVFHDKNVFLCNINYDSRSFIVHEQFFSQLYINYYATGQ